MDLSPGRRKLPEKCRAGCTVTLEPGFIVLSNISDNGDGPAVAEIAGANEYDRGQHVRAVTADTAVSVALKQVGFERLY